MTTTRTKNCFVRYRLKKKKKVPQKQVSIIG